MGEGVEYTDCISAEGENTPNDCPGYNIKQSNSETPLMLTLSGMGSTHSLPSIPDQLWPGVVAPDWPQSMGQRELFDI